MSEYSLSTPNSCGNNVMHSYKTTPYNRREKAMAHLYRYRLASTQIILHHDSSSVVVPRDHYRNMCNVWYCTTSLNLNSVGNAGDDVDG